MKKIIAIILLLNSFIFASEVATKDDIRQLSNQITESNKMLIKMIEMNQKATNKRFEDMQKYSDKRFEDMNKRFEDMNKRFDDMKKYSDKQFYNINVRLDEQVSLIKWGFGLVFMAILSQFWYLIRDRKEVTKDVTENLTEKLEVKLTKKADLKLVENIIGVLENFARTNRDIANILRQHNLRTA